MASFIPRDNSGRTWYIELRYFSTVGLDIMFLLSTRTRSVGFDRRGNNQNLYVQRIISWGRSVTLWRWTKTVWNIYPGVLFHYPAITSRKTRLVACTPLHYLQKAFHNPINKSVLCLKYVSPYRYRWRHYDVCSAARARARPRDSSEPLLLIRDS